MDLLRYSYENGRFVGFVAQYSDNKNNPVTPPYTTPKSLPTGNLKAHEYWAYLDKSGNVPALHLNGDWVKKIEFVAVTAYHKQTLAGKEFEDKTLVTDEYTIKKPKTQFDEWDGYNWITNIRNQYTFEYNVVDNRRRALYASEVDPLMAESIIKRAQAEELDAAGQHGLAEDKRQEAQDYKIRALQLRQIIQRDNPYPVNPDA